MRAQLPAEYHAALESRSALKGGVLHEAVLRLVISFKEKHDLVFPSTNTPLIMFKHVRDLCLPCKKTPNPNKTFDKSNIE